MSFERARYDICAYNQAVTDSMASAAYALQAPTIGPSIPNGYVDDPKIRLQKQGNGVSGQDAGIRYYHGGPVEQETDLLNLGRPLSRCSLQSQYVPSCLQGGGSASTDEGYPCGGGVVASSYQASGHPSGSTVDFQMEDTRLSNPAANLREATVDRFDPLLENPQRRVLFPTDFNISNRLIVKDNHRPCIPRPAVNDMSPEPKAVAMPKLDPNVPGVYTDPMYIHGVCN